MAMVSFNLTVFELYIEAHRTIDQNNPFISDGSFFHLRTFTCKKSIDICDTHTTTDSSESMSLVIATVSAYGAINKF